MPSKPQSITRWILALAVLVNLGIASRAEAALDNATCEDPETGDVFPCCTWCTFFCHCDLETPNDAGFAE